MRDGGGAGRRFLACLPASICQQQQGQHLIHVLPRLPDAAVYTCAPNDEECNSNADQAVLYCQVRHSWAASRCKNSCVAPSAVCKPCMPALCPQSVSPHRYAHRAAGQAFACCCWHAKHTSAPTARCPAGGVRQPEGLQQCGGHGRPPPGAACLRAAQPGPARVQQLGPEPGKLAASKRAVQGAQLWEPELGGKATGQCAVFQTVLV